MRNRFFSFFFRATRQTAWFSLAIFSGAASANALKDAWNCAKDTAKAHYTLMSKGLQAAEVLGSSPQCVAQALIPDVGLLTISGAMVAINGISPSILPANACMPALKSTAAWPIGKVLDGVFPGNLPAAAVDGAKDYAGEQIWQFLSTTPPFSEVTSRSSCGCTFLEAGITVETAKDMLKAIGQAGKSCDQFLNNVPGYAPIKNAARAGAYHLNDALEGVFVDQSKHMPPQEYYRLEFGGFPQSWEMESHALAKVLNPSHDPRTRRGATNYFREYVADDQLGAPSLNSRRAACVSYFDSHQMSNSNAQKVCDGLIAQFEADYQALVPRMAARHNLLTQLKAALDSRFVKWKNECNLAVKDAPFQTKDIHALQCTQAISQARGDFSNPDPYSATNSLGAPVDPNAVKAEIAKRQRTFHLPPVNASGLYERTLDMLDQPMDDTVKTLVASFDVAGRRAVDMAKAKVAAEVKAQKALTEQAFEQQVGQTWSGKCPSLLKDACVQTLRQAWELCEVQLSKVPPQNPFLEVSGPDPVALDATWKKCQQSYADVVKAYQQVEATGLQAYQWLQAYCPTQGLAASVCSQDALAHVWQCLGNLPGIDEAYYVHQKLAYQPMNNCAGVAEKFLSKWGQDEELQQSLTSARSSAAQECAALRSGTTCALEVDAQVQSCRDRVVALTQQYVEPLPMSNPALLEGLTYLQRSTARCRDRVTAVARRYAAEQQAPRLVAEQYGNACPNPAIAPSVRGICQERMQQVYASCQDGLQRPQSGVERPLALTPAVGSIPPLSSLTPGLSLTGQLSLPPDGYALMETAEQKVAACSGRLSAALADWGTASFQITALGCTAGRAGVFTCPAGEALDLCQSQLRARAEGISQCIRGR